jgi:two-component system, NtrC family, response regulator AtoC
MVETAEGGTLFLDEIGDMDIALQAKLLKLLEEKTLRRLGSLREQRVDVRIVAATHRPLEALVREGRFRADLYFRLGVVQLRLPPLRERGADILLLARHFLQHHATRYGKPAPVLDEAAEAVLLDYSWPGNVRELRNMIEQAVLLNSGGLITAQQLSLSHLGSVAGAAPVPAAADTKAPRSAELTLPEMERRALVNALQQNDGNVTRAARELGISRDTLRYRIEKYGLDTQAKPTFRDIR